ncbi:MAG: hypothetical protein GC191_09485 [Azospirillum sp.]|nr:hypothetical protein [Azospirillum sp.]
MNAAVAIAALDRGLAAGGETVTVLREGADPATVPAKTLGGGGFEPYGDGGQQRFDLVLSRTGLEDLLPLRVTDRLLVAGVERAVRDIRTTAIGAQTVRIELTVEG